MHSFQHWTWRYILNRVKEIAYHKAHPRHPWLTKSANAVLASRIRPSDVGLEFGSGRSTLWLAERAAFVTSVEHDSLWHQRISRVLKKRRSTNVDYVLCKKERDEEDGEGTVYVGVADRFADNSLDFVLVDGVYRSACANAAIDKLRPGGMLILDNANWFLPSRSISPSSRACGESPVSSQWERFLVAVKDWECIWTSDGVTDTAFYIKPGGPGA